MLTRTVELGVSVKSAGKALYARNFLKERGVPFEMNFRALPKHKLLRALFNDTDDRVYPFLVVIEHITDEDGSQQDRVVFQAAQVGVAKLYKAIRKYVFGDEAE